MKASSEKRKAIKYQIVYPLIIAFAAIGASYLVMHYSQNFYLESTKPPEIAVASDGALSLTLEGDRDDIYILWETDGGNLRPAEADPGFQEGRQRPGNGYMVYTHCDDAVYWDGDDAAGVEFETANVRAVIYYLTEGRELEYIGSASVERQASITVTKEDGVTVKAEEQRYFSNPVPPSGVQDEGEIYCIKEDDTGKTFRYRTYPEIALDDDSYQVLIWQSEEPCMGETNLAQGLVPVGEVKKDEDGQEVFFSLIRAVDTITVYGEKVGADTEIAAFLVDQDIYQQKEPFSDEQKQNLAAYSFSAASEDAEK